jgi:large subunit ribosomal protein L5
MSNFKDLYTKEITKSLKDEFKYTSAMQIPKLEKIVINIGAGDVSHNSKVLDACMND